MRKINFLAVATAAALVFAAVSCSSKTKDTKPENTEPVISAALQVDDVFAAADSLAGRIITVEGVCTHICKHGGKKLFLMGSDDTKTLRAEGGKVESFPAEVVNNIVPVTGTLVEDRIGETEIQKMEEQYQTQNAAQHGDNKEVGCETEKKAQGQQNVNTFADRMKDYRDRIADRKTKEGKDYLSFYHLETESYEIK